LESLEVDLHASQATFLAYPIQEIFAVGPGMEKRNLFQFPGDITHTNKFRVLAYGDGAMTYLDDVLLYNELWPYSVELNDNGAFVGLCSKGNGRSEEVFRISNARIRMLTEKPELME
jgi:hypothetical protein